MLKSLAFANAATVAGVSLYVVCRLLAMAAPEFLFSVGQSWFHTTSFERVKSLSVFDPGSFLFGGITLAAVIWITAYMTAGLYNRFARKN